MPPPLLLPCLLLGLLASRAGSAAAAALDADALAAAAAAAANATTPAQAAEQAEQAEQAAAPAAACPGAGAGRLAAACSGGGGRRPVCGSDGVTYPSRCHLLRARCAGAAVQLRHKGQCKEAHPCWADRQNLQAVPRPASVQLFEPRCLEDGSYAPVQCHNETGYCWCVNPRGRPVPNTSVRGKAPHCGRRGKAAARRRSSVGGRKNKRGCGRNERSLFVASLLHHFRAEYSRLPAAEAAAGEAAERAVLGWKFAATDRDGDGALGPGELAGLRRLVRKLVRPRRCARLFPRLCDRDADRRLSREEWAACLGLDFSHESPSEGAGAPSKDEVLQGSMSSRPRFGDDSPDTKEEPEANDCLSDRKTALEDQGAGTNGLYIPECTPDGRYKKIQCYNSTGYCWCVYEDSGIVIPGTSVKDQKPNCDIVPPPTRPMAGCPEPRKQLFIREFLELMKKRMSSSKDKPGSESITLLGGGNDVIATWTFQSLDKNKNKIWERKEWKNFRTLVMSHPQLRRCGKRLPRYCDVNNDQKISLTEWLNCLTRQSNSAANSKSRSLTNRNGTNPLLTYLN